LARGTLELEHYDGESYPSREQLEAAIRLQGQQIAQRQVNYIDKDTMSQSVMMHTKYPIKDRHALICPGRRMLFHIVQRNLFAQQGQAYDSDLLMYAMDAYAASYSSSNGACPSSDTLIQPAAGTKRSRPIDRAANAYK
jgi:hypothetical protein